MEKSTIFKFGKPSISMGHLYHGYVSQNQMEQKNIFRQAQMFWRAALGPRPYVKTKNGSKMRPANFWPRMIIELYCYVENGHNLLNYIDICWTIYWHRHHGPIFGVCWIFMAINLLLLVIFLHLLFASESAWWCWKLLLFHNSNTSNVWQTGFLSTSPAVLPATFPYGSPTDTSQHSHPTLNPEFLMQQHPVTFRGWILTFVTQITKVILLGQKSSPFSLKDLEL